MFIRNCWYVAAWADEIDNVSQNGGLIAVTIIGEPIVVFRGESGQLIALQDRCCHKQAKLSLGRVEGDCLRCMYHGLKFNAAGQCIDIPGQDTIPPGAAVASFPLIASGCFLWVWMGDHSLADPDLIPHTVALDDERWDLRRGQMDYVANYELINDNLTDFSHLSFVHPGSFGASPTFAAVQPLVKRLERGVRVARWMTGGADENKNVSNAVGRNADAPVTYMSYEYLVPGILTMRSETYRMEDFPVDGKSEPSGTPVMSNTNCQAVTPMTPGTSRYFFLTGPRRGPNSTAGAEKLLEIMKIAFEEDRVMIESQAANIALAPGTQMLTAHDRGPVQFRSIIKSLLKAEIRPDGNPATLANMTASD